MPLSSIPSFRPIGTQLSQRDIIAPSLEGTRARFGVAGCQHYEQGLFTAFRKLAAEEELDFVYHYGDYIYEGRGNRLWNGPLGPVENVRQHAESEIYSLDDYRRRYAQYKMDADLQAAHASAAWFTTWDDHETDNNWVSAIDQDGTPPEVFNLRRQAAAQAYYENMPLRARSFPVGWTIQLYRRAVYPLVLTVAMWLSLRFALPEDDRLALGRFAIAVRLVREEQ